MYKSRRELAKDQLHLMNHIRHYANVNIVTCGHCGTILLHYNSDMPITCYSSECKDRGEMDLSDCPDLWYEGCIENMEFDEDKPTQVPTTQVMERVYLGQIEKGIEKVVVYYTDYGYEIDFFSNDNLMANCELYDDDHVWRELEHRGYKKSFRKVILSML